MFGKSHLLLRNPVTLQGHTIRAINHPFPGMVSVEVVRPSARGGFVTRRWTSIGQLEINMADLESAVKKQKGAVRLN